MIISVIIPTYNGRRFLSPCLAAVKRSIVPPNIELEVIVVDNGSTDASADLVRTEFPWVKLLVFKDGLGFGRANNAARESARGEVICFLNNDTKVDPHWLARPLQLFAADTTIAAVGSKLLFMHSFVPVELEPVERDARIFIDSRVYAGPLDAKVRWATGVADESIHHGVCGRWIGSGCKLFIPVPIEQLDTEVTRPILRFFGSGSVDVKIGARAPRTLTRMPAIAEVSTAATGTVRLVQNAGSFINERGEGGDVGFGTVDSTTAYSEEESVPSLCGAALFVRRTMLDAAGWFPDGYTVYYEDTDLCLRLRQLGGRLIYCPRSVVNHYHTGTNREWSAFFVENVARSSLLFILHYAPWSLVARDVARRGRDLTKELVTNRHSGTRLKDVWNRAHGMRGTVGAAPFVPRILSDRLLRAFSHQNDQHDLFAFERETYRVPTSTVES